MNFFKRKSLLFSTAFVVCTALASEEIAVNNLDVFMKQQADDIMIHGELELPALIKEIIAIPLKERSFWQYSLLCDWQLSGCRVYRSNQGEVLVSNPHTRIIKISLSEEEYINRFSTYTNNIKTQCKKEQQHKIQCQYFDNIHYKKEEEIELKRAQLGKETLSIQPSN